jgi:uncharacterized Zn-binding protein involved in type VI secretion
MPAVSRAGDICSGHGCFPPRPAASGSGDVFINGAPALRTGDSFGAHACGTSAHASSAGQGSTSVFVNGKPLMRIGDPVNCGSVVAQGSPSVFAG